MEAGGSGEQAVGVRELAALLGVSRDTVYRLAKAGEIPGVRIGRLWRFWPEQVREHLERATRTRDPWARSPQSRAALERHERRRRGT